MDTKIRNAMKSSFDDLAREKTWIYTVVKLVDTLAKQPPEVHISVAKCAQTFRDLTRWSKDNAKEYRDAYDAIEALSLLNTYKVIEEPLILIRNTFKTGLYMAHTTEIIDFYQSLIHALNDANF